ncbi:GTP-binding domain [Sinorhizobium phage phiM9]|uniref:YspA cpYpsA-related SLOG domain-containing protein n=1 Tax=Sinorhizobium phage phiM9 TaxID=1636182 RepID=A0A0F6R7L5_9CAUD|nr:GTP-binding domain [Sinorhizobium phage phiM9]AKE44778.1 hypothetical protein Sm_phiM9_150 [Sinorhizobium phage phiM9]
MRLAVTGGRDFTDKNFIYEVLDYFHDWHTITSMTAGKARGVDRIAEKWAEESMIYFDHSFAADWDKHGHAAGTIRNQDILDRFKPNAVIAFPGGTGTGDMVTRVWTMKRKGSPIYLLEANPNTFFKL